MMELLSGPNLVAHVGGVSTSPTQPSRVFWDDELGIGSLGAPTNNENSFGFGANYFITQMDGVCSARGTVSPHAFMLDLSGQYEWALYQALVDQSRNVPIGYVYGFDKQTGVFEDKLVVANTSLFVNTLNIPQIRTSDRLIKIRDANVTKCALDGSDVGWVAEYTLTASLSNPAFAGEIPSVSRTKDPGVVCLIYPGGGILFYDVFAKQEVAKPWIPRIGANNGAWYSVKFDVYISYTISGGEWYVSVWANSVRPAALSNPEPVTPVVSGKVTQFRVRLLGAQGEPCEGELISWSQSGDGSLAAMQSSTGADGYAYIGYVAPITGGATATIQAVAEF